MLDLEPCCKCGCTDVKHNELKIFEYSGATVRTVEINGDPWFVAKDVCDALGYNWQPNVIKHVPSEWRGINRINTPSGEQDISILSEQGLYFFLARSDKPGALPMQKWIAGEVLPSIRKTGTYSVESDELMLARAVLVADKKIKQLTFENETMKPKAEKFDHFLSADNTMSMQEAAKSVGTGRTRLFNLLRMLKYLMDDNLPYQKYIESGLFVVIEVPVEIGGQFVNKSTTRVTPKGLSKISELVKDWEEVDNGDN